MQEYAKGAYLPVLLEAPINGILSPSVATAKHQFGESGMHTNTNPVAAHPHTGANGTKNYADGSHAPVEQTESHLGPHAINR